MEVFISNPFYYRLYGAYALFTDPVTKGGGEKFTYQIPTYQALKGITEEIYWKPTIYMVVDAIKVMKPFRTETKGMNSPLMNGSNDLNYYTYLKDVEYLIKVHFEWNMQRVDLEQDRDEKKHEQIFLRSLKRGGRRDLFLGTRECIAHIDYIRESDFETAVTPFEGTNISFGIMFHSFEYPGDPNNRGEDDSKLRSNFTTVVMKNGRVDFLRPEECEIHHQLNNYKVKRFDISSIRQVNEELMLFEKGGEDD